MDQSTELALLVMAILLIKHALFDFVFQGRYQLENKHIYGHPGGLLHAGLHIVGTASAFLLVRPSLGAAAAILAGEFAAHYHIDWAKDQLLRRTGWGYAEGRYWAVFGVDQLAHGLIYVAIVWALIAGAS